MQICPEGEIAGGREEGVMEKLKEQTSEQSSSPKKQNMKLQTFWYLIPSPLILKPYFISISYKGLKNSNIRRNVNSVMFSNVFVLHHIAYSLITMWNICPVSDANSPDQTCFLTHKPSLTSE